MSLNADTLYRLLPAVHRLRDERDGGPLRALLDVFAAQGRLVERDIALLYDDWFIETCSEWAVPYIGELLGVRGLRDLGEGTPYSLRAVVANTLAYRRRKGTVPVMEQLAFDVSGWPAKAVESFPLLAATQHVNHLRPGCVRTPDLRDAGALEAFGGPFDPATRSADVRRIESGRGRYNLPNLAVFLWRLQSYRLLRCQPAPGPAAGAYLVDPLGRDLPCFNPPRTEISIEQAAGEREVPGPLPRRPLYEELEARRQALAENREPARYWFDERPGGHGVPFGLHLDGVAVPPERIQVCNLSAWRQPPDQRTYLAADPGGAVTPVDLPISASVDPVLGRVMLSPAMAAAALRVDWCFGFSGDLGGGPYDRQPSLEAALDRPVTWQLGISRAHPPRPGEVVATLAEAAAAWNALPPGTVGLIVLMDSATWSESLAGASALRIPPGSRLIVAAADWPEIPVSGGLPGQTARQAGRISPSLRRPHLRGDVEVVGVAPAAGEVSGELILDGLLLEGNLRVLPGRLGRLRFAHGTLAPGAGRLSVADGNLDLALEIDRSICGGIQVPDAVDCLVVRESIVEGEGGPAISAPAAQVSLHAATVIGRTTALTISAENSLFTGPAMASRNQEGCVRFCYAPAGSRLPRRHRCQPDLALEVVSAANAGAVRARLQPVFTSLRHGDPGYGQLARECAAEIREGAEEGNEMGAFGFLRQAHRRKNLRAQLDAYLRFGMEAGFEYVT